MKPIKVVSAKYVRNYKIDIEFNDGTKNIIDLENELYGEVFEPLKDLTIFKSFILNPFTIEWENGADFSPEFLFELASKENSKLKLS